MTAPPRIALVGFMGSGKSTVGVRLAQRLGYRFADSDLAVEASTGSKVRALFEDRGEAAFRQLEREAIHALLEESRVVIATGGGAFVEPQTSALLREKSFVVYLECDFEEAIRRAHRSGGRPLLDGGDQVAAALFAARKEKYAQAHTTVPTTRQAPLDVVAEIIRRLPSS